MSNKTEKVIQFPEKKENSITKGIHPISDAATQACDAYLKKKGNVLSVNKIKWDNLSYLATAVGGNPEAIAGFSMMLYDFIAWHSEEGYSWSLENNSRHSDILPYKEFLDSLQVAPFEKGTLFSKTKIMLPDEISYYSRAAHISTLEGHIDLERTIRKSYSVFEELLKKSIRSYNLLFQQEVSENVVFLRHKGSKIDRKVMDVCDIFVGYSEKYKG